MHNLIEPELSANAKNLLARRYLLKREDGSQETPKELFWRVAKAVASAEEDPALRERYAEEFYEAMATLKFLPNSPTLMNAGTDLGQLSACFVLKIDDSMEGIFKTVKDAALIWQSGGGTGFALSRIRPKGDMVKSTGGVASGPLSFAEVLNSATNTVKQGGKRRGANMAVLRVDHPDIEEFIDAKTELTEHNQALYEEYHEILKASGMDPKLIERRLAQYRNMLLFGTFNEKGEVVGGQFTNFNFSVGITDKFMDAVKNKTDFELVSPRTGEVVRKVYAPDLFDKISRCAWETGEPGVVFLDKINAANPLRNYSEIEATNPCGEQPLINYESCNLGSINLAKFAVDGRMNWYELGETVKLAVRFLDNVIDVNKYPIKEIEDD